MKTGSKIVKLNNQQEDEGTASMPAKNDHLGMAKYLEKKSRLDEAAKVYEKLIITHPTTEFSYNRLMIIYRKQKDYKQELRVINTGLKAFTDYYTPSLVGKNKNVVKLSKQLSIMVGLSDKKGKNLYDAEPVNKWKKRKEIVLIKKKKP